MLKNVHGLMVFLVIALYAPKGYSRLLLISDIDDTIKISRVNSFIEKLDLAFNFDSRFKGMSELYHLITEEHKGRLDLFYLSNAPSFPMQFSHEEFLSVGQFPLGHVQLREDESEDMHKVIFLRQWIQSLSPSTVILVGDNGERDALFYHQIADEFSHLPIRFLQFIRLVYNDEGHRLLPNQVGFVTPIEMALELKQHGLLSEIKTQSFIQKIENQILSEHRKPSGVPAYFPSWMECSQWQSPLKTPGWGDLALNQIAQICGVASLNSL